MDSVTAHSVGDLATLIPSFQRCSGSNKSPKTIATYGEAANQLLAFLPEIGDADRGRPDRAGARRDRSSSGCGDQVSGHGQNRYRALTALFNFLVDFGEITVSPMAKMKPPTSRGPRAGAHRRPASPPAGCLRRQGLEDRRDTAVLRLFLDSGMRLSELTNLTVADVDLDARVAVVMGKGRRPVPALRRQDGQCLDRYMLLGPVGPGRHRCTVGRHRGADGTAGIRSLVERRAEQPASVTFTPTCSATASPTALADGGNRDGPHAPGRLERREWSRYAASSPTRAPGPPTATRRPPVSATVTDELRSTAYHEAGHVAASYFLPRPVQVCDDHRERGRSRPRGNAVSMSDTDGRADRGGGATAGSAGSWMPTTQPGRAGGPTVCSLPRGSPSALSSVVEVRT